MSDNDLIKRGEVRKLAAPLETEDGEILVVDMDDVDEIPAVPHEMSAREFLKIIENLNYYDHEAYQRYAWRKVQHDYAGAVAVVEAWAREHLERSEDDGEM